MDKKFFLTKTQYGIYVYIKTFQETNKYFPTYKEIAAQFKVTIPTVQGYIDQLAIKGAIKKLRGKSRAYVIIDENEADEMELRLSRLERIVASLVDLPPERMEQLERKIRLIKQDEEHLKA